MSANTLYTIGHSTLEVATFVELLQENSITVLADVRSSPYSRFKPEYNREALGTMLKHRGIEYLFLGAELGARRHEEDCYEVGVATYERIARAPLFQSGLDRLRESVNEKVSCLMCAEKDPLTCHRAILISRHLCQEIPIVHILGPGSVEAHQQAELRLLDLLDLPRRDLFRSREELIAEAYERQGRAIAYRETSPAEF